LQDVERHLRVVILAGGIGSRFWPASTPARPKPLLALGPSGRPLLVETVERAATLAGDRSFAILTGSHLADPFLRAVPELDPSVIWIEPRARGTAPVLTWAAHRLFAEDPNAVMVSLHSDHVVQPEAAFAPLLRQAASLALSEDILVTIAVPPDRPETGYGYLKPGAPLGDPAAGGPVAFHVDAFVEKPDEETARAYLAHGYLWNSGLFVFPVARFLEEIRIHAPEIAKHLPLLDQGEVEAFFEQVPTISVDEAVMERSGAVGAVRATFSWDDVGGWEALSRTRTADVQGNSTLGEVHAVDTRNSIAWAEDGPIVLFGVEGLVVVRSGGTTLVTTRARAPELKELLARLPEHLRDGRDRFTSAEPEGPVSPRSGTSRGRTR